MDTPTIHTASRIDCHSFGDGTDAVGRSNRPWPECKGQGFGAFAVHTGNVRHQLHCEVGGDQLGVDGYLPKRRLDQPATIQARPQPKRRAPLHPGALRCTMVNEVRTPVRKGRFEKNVSAPQWGERSGARRTVRRRPDTREPRGSGSRPRVRGSRPLESALALKRPHCSR